MPKNPGIGDEWVQPTKRIQITATEPHHSDLQQKVPLRGHRIRNRLDDRLSGIPEYERFHL
jgi:hypothetical protein